MSQPITLYRRIGGILTDATTVTLADQTATFGIMKLDNQQVVVAAGAATTHLATGVYQYDISALDPRYTYVASWKIVGSFGTDYWTELINPPGTVVTRGAVRASAARMMGLLVAEGITSSATNLTIVDTTGGFGGLASDSDSVYRFDGCYALMTTGPATGTWRECSAGKFQPSTGTLTVAAAWTSGGGIQPTSGGGDRYEIYAGLTPDQWSLRDNYSILDNALYRCRYMRRSPITLVPDGDTEMNGVTAWTANNASLVKTAIDSVTFGRQSLLVINSGANGVAESTSIPVIPGHGYQVWADYRCVGANKSTASLIVWDKTNGAQIQAGTDQDSGVNFEGGRTSTGFTVPANCYQVTMRLQGTETNAVVAWENIILVTNGRRRYPTPRWIQNRNQIMSYVTRDGSRPFEDKWSSVGWPQDIQEDPTALNTFVIDIPLESVNRPLFVVGEGAYGPMSGVSDNLVTACPLEWAKRSAAREAWQSYSRHIEGATMARAVADRAVIEMLAAQADGMYMPLYESTIGMPSGFAGLEVTRLP